MTEKPGLTELAELPEELRDAPESEVSPPVETAPRVLPLRELDWQDFERLVVVVAREVRGCRYVRLYGTPGQKQFGIDLYGLNVRDEYEVFQARDILRLTRAGLRKAVEDYRDEGRRLEATCLIVAVACSTNRTELNDELVALREDMPFAIELWDAEELSELLQSSPGIVERFFGTAWRRLFSGEGVRDEQAPTRAAVDADVLLLGPLRALGLAARVETARGMLEPDPARAAVTFGEVAAQLVGAGYPAAASQIQHARASALRRAGDVAGAFDLGFELACSEQELGELRAQSTLLHGLQDLPDLDDGRVLRRDAFESYLSWWERQPTLVALGEQTRALLDRGDPFGPQAAAWFAELVITDRDTELLTIAGDLADRALDVVQNEVVASRLRATWADIRGIDTWRPVLHEATTRRIEGRHASFLCARAGRYLAWNNRPEEAEDAYRRAVELAVESHLSGDAAAYLEALDVIGWRYGRFQDASNQRAALAQTMEGSATYLALPRATRARALAALADLRHPDAHDYLWRMLWEGRVSGHLATEFEANRRLGELYIGVGEPAVGIYHLTRDGSARPPREVTSRLPAAIGYQDLDPEPAPWNRGAVYAVLAAQGDLLPRDDACGRFGELLEATSEPAPAIAPVVPIEAFNALGRIALQLTADQADTLLPKLTEATRGGNHWLNHAVVDALIGLYKAHPQLRPEIASMMAGGFEHDDFGRELSSRLGELTRIGVPVRDALRPLADGGQAAAIDALTLLDESHSRLAALATDRAERILDQDLASPRTSWGFGGGFQLGNAHMDTLDADVMLNLADRLLYLADDETDLALNRANALSTFSALTHRLSSERRRAAFDRALHLAGPVQLSRADEWHAASQHALSRIRIGLPIEELPAAALMLSAQLASDDAERSVVATRAHQQILAASTTTVQAVAAVAFALGPPYFEAAELVEAPFPPLRCAGAVLWARDPSRGRELGWRFAQDPDRSVRLALANSLESVRESQPTEAANLRAVLVSDSSALVRWTALEARIG